jgi:NTP pyrophosphatase (non-canonical NTP hydrolase)
MEEETLKWKLSEILGKDLLQIEKTSFVKLLEKMVKRYEEQRDRVSSGLCADVKSSNVDNNKIVRKNEMDFNTYQELSMRTMPNVLGSFTEKDKTNYAMGLAGEAGEVVDYLKKVIHHKHPINVDTLKKEMGDVLHYLAGLGTMYDIQLEEVATLNIDKLGKRYPNGFKVEDSVKRVDVKQVFQEEDLQKQYEHLNAVGEIGEMINGDK